MSEAVVADNRTILDRIHAVVIAQAKVKAAQRVLGEYVDELKLAQFRLDDVTKEQADV